MRTYPRIPPPQMGDGKADEEMQQEEQQEQDAADHATSQAMERVINDEYKVWKKNSPFLYE
jgi:hypothetical protein